MRSFPIFAVLFFILPILEIYILIKAGSSELIGPLWTIMLVVSTAVIGAFLLRQQGVSTLARLQGNLSKGKIPAQEIVEGVLLAVGGALLMTPGFITDTMGFLCLLPFSRQFLARAIMKRSAMKMSAGVGSFTQAGGFNSDPFGRGFDNDINGNFHDVNADGDIVEGEFTEVEKIESPGQHKK